MDAVQTDQDRRVVITGAASGIGLATARAFAAAGARLALLDVDADRLNETAADLPGTDHLLIPTDVANVTEIQRAFRQIGSVLKHLILPVTTIVLSLLAVGTRLTRATILEELSKPYVRVAASKGLSARRVLFGHVLKNTLNPIITVTSVQLAYLLAWTILIEAIFNWPGIGLYAYDSFQALDYNPIMGLTLVVSVAFVLINLITDLLYPIIDPRIAR
jgi:ABC-type dipeptide/oligopeptide/nickel transport system permease component